MEEIFYLMHLFEKNNLNYLFMGHTHTYYQKTVNGINYINVPSFKDAPGEYYIRVYINGTDVSYEKLMI